MATNSHKHTRLDCKQCEQKSCHCVPERDNILLHTIINFTPSWFSVNMGTGIISILLYSAPHQFNGQHIIATVFFVLNIVLFCIFFLLSVLRYILYPWVAKLMLYHSAQSLFIGTFPMGLSTIINAIVLIAVPAYGDWAINLAQALWWIDVAVTVASAYGVTYLMFNIHTASVDTMTAAWLLPIVPAVVTAASGGLVASVLQNPNTAMIILTTSWILWGAGIGLTLLVLAFYFHRLMLHKLPPREVIISAFLPLGPLGQGSFGIMQMGIVARDLFDSKTSFTSVQNSGEMIYVGSMLLGLILWGFGSFWLFHGITCLLKRSLEGSIKFNMGFWGLIFPLGVYTAATIQLGKQLPSEFFSYLSIIFVICLVILWLYVAGFTLYKAITREIIVAPCLSGLQTVKQHEQVVVNKKAEQETEVTPRDALTPDAKV